jgi:predicted ester cyclase
MAETDPLTATLRLLVEEVWNRGNLSAADELLAPDAAVHLGTGQVVGPAGFKAFVVLWRQAFPDWQCTIEDLACEGEALAQRWVGRGTHLGELQGVPPTGRRVIVSGIDMVRFAEGRIAARWGEVDALGLLQQLGVAPTPMRVALRSSRHLECDGRKIISSPDHARRQLMSVETSKANVRRVIEEALNGQNVAALDELYTPDYVYRNPPPGISPDRAGAKQWFAIVHAGFPDIHFTVEDQIAEEGALGVNVVTRFTARGTHSGDFMGVSPTGKQITISGILFERVTDSRTAESWVEFDQLGMLQQLGVIPAPS